MTTQSHQRFTETLSEADAVFNERVSRGDIEVTLWKMDGSLPELIAESS